MIGCQVMECHYIILYIRFSYFSNTGTRHVPTEISKLVLVFELHKSSPKSNQTKLHTNLNFKFDLI
jgi:hypothetical protein